MENFDQWMYFYKPDSVDHSETHDVDSSSNRITRSNFNEKMIFSRKSKNRTRNNSSTDNSLEQQNIPDEYFVYDVDVELTLENEKHIENESIFLDLFLMLYNNREYDYFTYEFDSHHWRKCKYPGTKTYTDMSKDDIMSQATFKVNGEVMTKSSNQNNQTSQSQSQFRRNRLLSFDGDSIEFFSYRPDPLLDTNIIGVDLTIQVGFEIGAEVQWTKRDDVLSSDVESALSGLKKGCTGLQGWVNRVNNPQNIQKEVDACCDRLATEYAECDKSKADADRNMENCILDYQNSAAASSVCTVDCSFFSRTFMPDWCFVVVFFFFVYFPALVFLFFVCIWTFYCFYSSVFLSIFLLKLNTAPLILTPILYL